jgi:hypothetical protein
MSLAQQKLSCHGAGETWEMGTEDQRLTATVTATATAAAANG